MFICINCGNQEFFETEIEVTKSIFPTVGNLEIDNLRFDDYDVTEDYLRSNLYDMIESSSKIQAYDLYFDPQLNRYHNNLISCACCNSNQVTVQSNSWSPPSPYSTINEELIANRHSYLKLKKGKTDHADKLPMLWRPT